MQKPLSDPNHGLPSAAEVRLYLDILTPLLEGIWIAKAMGDKPQARFWAQKLGEQVSTFTAESQFSGPVLLRTVLNLFANETQTKARRDEINEIMRLAGLTEASRD